MMTTRHCVRDHCTQIDGVRSSMAKQKAIRDQFDKDVGKHLKVSCACVRACACVRVHVD
jgi:hypothetical protein